MGSEGRAWYTDTYVAVSADSKEDIDGLLFHTDSIDQFLSIEEGIGNAKKYFVVAGKGIGKTLLLIYKRHLIAEKYGGSVTYIPNNKPIIDFSTVLPQFDKSTILILMDHNNCKRICDVAIMLAVLSYSQISGKAKDCIQNILDNKLGLSQKIKICSYLDAPCSVLQVLGCLFSDFDSTTLNQIINNLPSTLNNLYCHSLKQPICIFMDALDQMMDDAPTEIWHSMQIGMMRAAWDRMRSNNHVKIYMSIREEAFAYFHGKDKAALSSFVFELKYSSSELKKLFHHLLKFYEGKSSIEDFLGVSTFSNATTGKEEDIFQFMNRYSIGRPRDFANFGLELSSYISGDKKKKMETILAKDELKRVIVRTASNTIVHTRFDEMQMFLQTIKNESTLKKVLSTFNHNILTEAEVKIICREYNHREEGTCEEQCQKCSSQKKLFCDLYNMGFIGLIDNHWDIKQQKFKSPNDHMVTCMPQSEYYLIHPALRFYIEQLNPNYHLIPGILVGDGIEWKDDYDKYMALHQDILSIQDMTIRKDILAAGLSRVIDTCKKYLNNKCVNKKDKEFMAKIIKNLGNLYDFFPRRIEGEAKEKTIEDCEKCSTVIPQMIPIPLYSKNGENYTCIGTAFPVQRYDDKVYLVTCKHVIKKDTQVYYRINNNYLELKESDILYSGDPTIIDLVVIKCPINIQGVCKIAETDRHGYKLYIIGYTQGAINSAPCIEYECAFKSRGGRVNVDIYSINSTLQMGISGSPILDCYGILYGMVTGEERDSEKQPVASVIPVSEIKEIIEGVVDCND